MTKTKLILAAAALLLTTAACNAPPQSPAPPVETAPSTVEVGPNQTRPTTSEERRQIATDRAVKERQAVGLKRVFTGDHCAVYEFQNADGVRYIFVEGFRDSGGRYTAMACAVAKA
ncbi:hypothetical protein MARCHEWKA_02710 [Brevundimonas phage vB_BpoS-Marchewka]|uniref:Lipoprotein n=1 Tax=Brevundimonas phage vB_BpoS-Marchewka TaxID=2948604 RepID=A0A9E7N4R7_9CAUD|nr:hypothetical protein MARCHEWKA_02710 [Brevundimonas phage vB_BpoS-Marchewka]